jgi:hypothetical protein
MEGCQAFSSLISHSVTIVTRYIGYWYSLAGYLRLELILGGNDLFFRPVDHVDLLAFGGDPVALTITEQPETVSFPNLRLHLNSRL